MRCRRRMACGRIVLGLSIAGFACAQNLTEFGAAAATGAAGGAGGKKVSDGINAVFGKVDDQTKAAAKQEQTKPDKAATAPATSASASSSASSVPASSGATSATVASPAASSPGASGTSAPRPKAVTPSKAARSAKAEPPSVPDPPALPHAAVVNKTPEPAPRPVPAAEPALVVPPPPPPPEVTAENLKSLAPGTAREDLLKLGSPASRITMFGDDGHLLEIYSYVTKGATFGVVRLSDGAVSKVELR
jgi:hypothetical protein